MHSVIVSTVLLAADGGVQDELLNIEFAPLPSSPHPHTCTHCSPHPRNHIRPHVPQSFIMFYSGNPFESRITESAVCCRQFFILDLSGFSAVRNLHLIACIVFCVKKLYDSMRHDYYLLYNIIAQNMLTCNTPKKYAHIYTYAFHCLMTCLHILLLLHDIRTPDYA